MGDNSAALATMDSMIERIRNIPGIAVAAAPDCALAVEADVERTIRAGTTSNGVPWAPLKEGGGKALVGAEKSLSVVAVGSRVFAALRGHIARHHLGRAKGGTVRPILPTSPLIPPVMADAVGRVLSRHFARTTGTT